MKQLIVLITCFLFQCNYHTGPSIPYTITTDFYYVNNSNYTVVMGINQKGLHATITGDSVAHKGDTIRPYTNSSIEPFDESAAVTLRFDSKVLTYQGPIVLANYRTDIRCRLAYQKIGESNKDLVYNFIFTDSLALLAR